MSRASLPGGSAGVSTQPKNGTYKLLGLGGGGDMGFVAALPPAGSDNKELFDDLMLFFVGGA